MVEAAREAYVGCGTTALSAWPAGTLAPRCFRRSALLPLSTWAKTAQHSTCSTAISSATRELRNTILVLRTILGRVAQLPHIRKHGSDPARRLRLVDANCLPNGCDDCAGVRSGENCAKKKYLLYYSTILNFLKLTATY